MTRSERIARTRASSATSSAPTAASATNNAKTPINNAKANAKTLKATPLPAGSTVDSLEKMMNQYTKAELKRLLRSAWGEVATRRNEILTLRAVVTNLRQDLAHYHATGLPRISSSISSGPLTTTFTIDSNNNHHNNNNNINIVNNRNTPTPRARHPQHTNEDPYFFLSTNASRMVSPAPAAGHMPPAGVNGLVTPTPMSTQDQHYQQQYQQQPQEQEQGTAASSVTTTATTAMMMGDMDMMDGRGMEGGEEEVDPLLEALLNEQGGVEGVGGEGGLMAEFVMHWGGSEGEDGKEEEKPAGMVGMSVVVNE